MDSVSSESIPDSSDKFTLRSKFNASERLVESVDADSVPEPALKHAIGNLQLCAKCVSVLALFSRNESLDDVPTSSLPYLLIPAYLGYLTQRLTVDKSNGFDGIPRAREKIVSASLNYYRQCFKLFRDYSAPGVDFIPQAASSDDERADDERADDAVESMRPAVTDADRRARNIKRYRRQQELSASFKKQAKADADAVAENVDADDEMRIDRINMLELWLLKSAEDFDLLSRESAIIKNIQHATPQQLQETRLIIGSRPPESSYSNGSSAGFSGANVVKLDATSYQSLLTPVRLLRFEESKKVFGAGYPSLPKYSIEEYYDHMARQGKCPGGYVSEPRSANVTRIEPADDEDASAEEARKAKKDKEESDDDDAALQKARSWDEFKDDNPRGWGNRKNKG